jgi:hypothetical protein
VIATNMAAQPDTGLSVGLIRSNVGSTMLIVSRRDTFVFPASPAG